MNIARIGKKLFVIAEVVGVRAYDFNFELHFDCEHPYRIDGENPCVMRVGAISDYASEFNQRLQMGLRLVNTPEEHARASELEHWYPRLRELTPRTLVFDALPGAAEIEANFDWPVFLKGSRQTSKHDPELSVIRGREQYASVMDRYRKDPILHWQKPVIREFIPLMPVAGTVPGKVRPSVEYRSFWWNGECVGWGRYWYQVAPYACSDIDDCLALAQQVADRLAVPFLVVDLAKTADGRWIVIECNDAQEAGYAGVSPSLLWQQILLRVGT
jgi:hypothetical protein